VYSPKCGVRNLEAAKFCRSRRERPELAPSRPAEGLPAFAPRELSAPATSEIVPPPASVTESTTRSLAGRR
jgi:hypothetical protein